jgi:hypothetical protein
VVPSQHGGAGVAGGDQGVGVAGGDQPRRDQNRRVALGA